MVSQVRISTPLLLAVLGVMLAGCIALPLGTVGGIDPATRQKLATDVPLYDSPQLPPRNFIKVGMITASDCDNTLLGGPGREGVIAKIRQQAQAMGANGITDLSCDHADTGTLRGCLSATECSATALKIFAPETATN